MTLPFRARDVAAWSEGTLLCGDRDRSLAGVSIDSRSVSPGQLFVAIFGPRHDGHDHLAQALASGAAGLVVQRGRALPEPLPDGLPAIAVHDTTRALGAIATGHRSGYGGPLVAITGSNGKTTTKEMCAAILAVAGPCLHTEGNLNNEYGLPLTLLRRAAEHRSVVVELGMNHRGEIARLAEIAEPTVGVITNVGTAHIEHLGSREEIGLEKGDLVARLPADGVAVLNADDPRALAQGDRGVARVRRFGRAASAEVRAEGVRSVDGRGFAFDLCAPEGRVAVEVRGLSETTISNALAAAAAALVAGAGLEDVPAGLAAYRPPRGRLEPIALPRGGLLIDDTYNANPQSLEVALRILAQPAGDGARGRAVAVLGDMGELGDASDEAHREAGRLAGELGVDLLFAVGSRAELVAQGAATAGMSGSRVCVADDWKEIAERVAEELSARDRVLVKGSRAMRMERIVEYVLERAGAGGGR